MGIIRHSACEPTTQPTTHNPQPTTHNPQLTTSRWATTTLPSSCSARYLHGNSRHSPGSWFRCSLWSHTKGAHGQVWRQDGWMVCLFCGQNETTSKNREEYGALALGGHRLDVKRNNQPIVGVSSEGIIIEETWLRWNMWGGRRIIVWGWQIERQKKKKMKYTVAFGRPPIDNGSHNNQPKTCVRNRGEYGEDVRRSGGTGGSAIPLFWGC